MCICERAYDEKWTEELFTIIGRQLKQGTSQYTIKDYNKEVIRGMFYGSELQRDRSYNIE